MTRETWLPLDPSAPPGTSRAQTSGAWLSAEMARRGISNAELYRRLRTLGFRGGSANIIAMWRHDRTPIAPETLPLILEALGLPPAQRQHWAMHFLHALYPNFASLLRGGA